jgi:hypothetical protein
VDYSRIASAPAFSPNLTLFAFPYRYRCIEIQIECFIVADLTLQSGMPDIARMLNANTALPFLI